MWVIKPLLAPKTLLLLALVYTVILTGVSIIERDSLPKVPIFPMQDKLAHFLAYFVLAVLWGAFWLRRKTPAFLNRFLPIMLVAAFIYGTIIEVLQSAFYWTPFPKWINIWRYKITCVQYIWMSNQFITDISCGYWYIWAG